MFKPFQPKDTPPSTGEEISRLFQKGDFQKAIQQAKKIGEPLCSFQADIEAGARKLLLSRRSSELLSTIYRNAIIVQYDLTTLLSAAFDAGDYHGFLKNAYRFKVHAGLDDKITGAIDCLMKKNQIHDAQAWQRKFEELRKQDG
jgi:hypothetical protein